MKEEENIKNMKLIALKRSDRMNQRIKSSVKLVANLPNDIMAYEEPSNPLLLQILVSLSTDSIKDSYQHPGGKIVKLSDLKKRMVETEIVRNWGESI